MSPEIAHNPIENLSSILMRFSGRVLPRHIASFKQRPAEPSGLWGVLVEQSNTGRQGVDRELLLKITRQSMKYMIGWEFTKFCCSGGNSLKSWTWPRENNLSIALTIIALVEASLLGCHKISKSLNFWILHCILLCMYLKSNQKKISWVFRLFSGVATTFKFTKGSA